MVRDSAPGGKRKFLLRRYSGVGGGIYFKATALPIPLPKENGPILTSDGTVLFYPNLNQSPSPISSPYSHTRNSSPCLPYQQTSRQTRGEVSPSVLMSMTRESGPSPRDSRSGARAGLRMM